MDIGYALSDNYNRIGLLSGAFSSVVQGGVFESYIEGKKELSSWLSVPDPVAGFHHPGSDIPQLLHDPLCWAISSPQFPSLFHWSDINSVNTYYHSNKFIFI